MFHLIVLVCLIGAGLSAPTEELDLPILGIAGGTKAQIESLPYQVSIEYYGGHHCGGTIVKDNVVITAAHCTILSTKGMTVRAGTNHREHGGVSIPVISIKDYPKYNHEILDNDISILFLAAPFTFNDKIKSIALQNRLQQPKAGSLAVVSGWGNKEEKGELQEFLQQASIYVYSKMDCRQSLGSKITQSMMCAGEKGKDACQADSGGPLVSDGKLIGVVSWGVGCARGYPGVFTNIGMFRDWIDSTIKKGP